MRSLILLTETSLSLILCKDCPIHCTLFEHCLCQLKCFLTLAENQNVKIRVPRPYSRTEPAYMKIRPLEFKKLIKIKTLPEDFDALCSYTLKACKAWS